MSGNSGLQSTSSPPPDIVNGPESSNIPERLNELQRALQRDRDRVQANQEATQSALQSLLDENRNMPSRRRRPTRRRPSSGDDNNLIHNRPGNALPTVSRRPGILTVGERNRHTRAQNLATFSTRRNVPNSYHARQHLDIDVSGLAELLDPPGSVPRSRARHETPDISVESRRRPKRRKLDHDSSEPSCQGLPYGHFGQVVSGKLRMEIMSCDGGEYSNDATATYSPDNVLRDDKSVYCTRSSRCNLLLRHPGEISFTLEKIIIKAPERGFTAPVQEGMIFVSMTSDTILQDTAAYQIQHNACPRTGAEWTSNYFDHFDQNLELPRPDFTSFLNRIHSRRLAHSLPTSEGIDFEAATRTHPSLLRNYSGRGRREEGSPSRMVRTSNRDSAVSRPIIVYPDVSAQQPPPVTVTMESEHSSSEEEEEEESSVGLVGDQFQREATWRGESENVVDDDDRALLFHQNVRQEQYNVRAGSSGMPLPCDCLHSGPSIIGPKEVSPEVTEPLLAPNARFFIRKDRNTVKIKFDPPISGKFVLLKFWSPLYDGNIDIQHVAAYGFAGLRYFPAIQLR